ncbi:hypothetical protein OKW35_003024 [Paraburkholderia sp. MM5477-R1]
MLLCMRRNGSLYAYPFTYSALVRYPIVKSFEETEQ